MVRIGMLLARTMLVALAAFPNVAAAPAAADGIAAVMTSGAGALTKCRDWFVYNSCTTYHKVALPERIAVGDTITLTYGSNPKDYVFHVAGLALHGDSCTILSDHSGAAGKGEKIEVAQCRAAAKSAADAR